MFGQKRYRFSLSITKEQLLAVYKGAIQRVRIRAYDGTVLELDANRLKMFTTIEGIYGEFELVTTMENKFVELRQLS